MYSSVTYTVPLCAIIPSLVFEIPVLTVYAKIKTMGPYLPRWSLLPVPTVLPDQNLKSQDNLPPAAPGVHKLQTLNSPELGS